MNELIREKFSTRLQSKLVGVGIQHENIDFDRSGLSEWVRVVHIPGKAFNASLSRSKKIKIPGIFDLRIFVKRGTGTKRTRELADTISDSFRNFREVDGTFEIFYLVPTNLGGDAGDENLYWIDVQIPFVAEDTKADITS